MRRLLVLLPLVAFGLKAAYRSVKVGSGEVQTKLIYHDTERPLVIFLSGANCPSESYNWLTVALAKRGLAVLTATHIDHDCLLSLPYDLSRLESLDKYREEAPSLKGLKAVVESLKSFPVDLDRVAIGGHSSGGRAVLDMIAFNQIDALCAFTYGASFVNGPRSPLAPTIVPFRNEVPLLLIGGDRDGVSQKLSSVNDPLETIQRTLENGGELVEARVVKGANHLVACDPPPLLDHLGDMSCEDPERCRAVLLRCICKKLASVGMLAEDPYGIEDVLELEVSPQGLEDDGEDLSRFVEEAQRLVLEVDSVQVHKHDSLGTFMSSKPSKKGDEVACHYFLEPNWQTFKRPLNGEMWTYTKEAPQNEYPAIALKMKRGPKDDVGKALNTLAAEYAFGSRVKNFPLADTDRILEDDPNGPFGNKGGKYVESSILREAPIKSPSILTPFDEDIPAKFRAQHYLKILNPLSLRSNYVGQVEDLFDTFEFCFRRIVAQLNLTRAEKGNESGLSVQGYKGSRVAWAVRYESATGKGLNVWLSPTSEIPHFTMYVKKNSVMFDMIPRRDLVSNPEYYSKYYSTEQRTTTNMTPLTSSDPRVRMVRSPHFFAYESQETTRLAAALMNQVQRFLRFCRTEEDSSSKKEIEERDLLIRKILRDHEASAGIKILGKEKAFALATLMAGLQS